jgi:hypothetical protein
MTKVSPRGEKACGKKENKKKNNQNLQIALFGLDFSLPYFPLSKI